ncbi:hypothetical protein HK102_001936 [Quaeritorhiza haematococci]|nr:hypothetical protein HK102_001936 [Quaeritorhiza haematococci]
MRAKTYSIYQKLSRVEVLFLAIVSAVILIWILEAWPGQIGLPPPTNIVATDDQDALESLVDVEFPLHDFLQTTEQDHTPKVHVVWAAEAKYSFAIAGCMRSIIANTRASPDTLRFHIVTSSQSEKAFFERQFASIFADTQVRVKNYEVVVFDYFPDFKWIFDTREDLYTPLNYARFYLDSLFPEVDKFIYLDHDTVVQGDIVELYNTDLARHGLAAVESCQFELRLYRDLNFNLDSIRKRFDPEACTFIAGVLIIDVAYWRKHNIRSELERWMKKNADSWPDYIYMRGSQSPLVLVFLNKYKKLDISWHVSDLGWNSSTDTSKKSLDKARILHWNGPLKPWTDTPRFPERWTIYFPDYEKYRQEVAPMPPPVPTIQRTWNRKLELMPLVKNGVFIYQEARNLVGVDIIMCHLRSLGLKVIDVSMRPKSDHSEPFYLHDPAWAKKAITTLSSIRKKKPFVSHVEDALVVHMQRNWYFSDEIVPILLFRNIERREDRAPSSRRELPSSVKKMLSSLKELWEVTWQDAIVIDTEKFIQSPGNGLEARQGPQFDGKLSCIS